MLGGPTTDLSPVSFGTLDGLTVEVRLMGVGPRESSLP